MPLNKKKKLSPLPLSNGYGVYIEENLGSIWGGESDKKNSNFFTSVQSHSKKDPEIPKKGGKRGCEGDVEVDGVWVLQGGCLNCSGRGEKCEKLHLRTLELLSFVIVNNCGRLVAAAVHVHCC
ncbi:hypothetical protein AABB24_038123 [Solanum stoloniferum]|uniref:Uncharacterized protein n=1 Tax=Solanum stoloniferum TaxID=62892 RepID=A0ABD2QYS0_9SOLN